MERPQSARRAGARGGFFIARAVALVYLLGAGMPELRAAGDPYYGYSSTSSYFLNYATGSFTSDNTNGVTIGVRVGSPTASPLDVVVDTGSRGFFASGDLLGDSVQPASDSYAGEIELTSSHRVYTGSWISTTLTFDVTDQATNSPAQVQATPYILRVDTLGAQAGNIARYDIPADKVGDHTSVTLDGGGSVPIQNAGGGVYYFELSGDQTVSYANDSAGLLPSVSNFGIGFDLNGTPGGTGPIGNNRNQIYNPLINLDAMPAEFVTGYIITPQGIQLGLTASDAGYAYTTLNPTGFVSTNSAPDWQTPMGQTVVDGGAPNGPGSVVMDSGFGGGFIRAPDLAAGQAVSGPVTVFLMNSGGKVGYQITNEPGDILNPNGGLTVPPPPTGGIYSQNQPPYGDYFLNTGWNVFRGFQMLYDAENGYMGVLPTDYGAADSNVFFEAIPGGYPNPIPEPGTVALLLLGLSGALLVRRLRRD